MRKSVKLLAAYLDVKPSEAQDLIDSGDYILLSDSEADQAARDYILESVWAFRPEFLAAHTKDGIDAEVIRSIQANDRCEDNNADILALIDDVDHSSQESRRL